MSNQLQDNRHRAADWLAKPWSSKPIDLSKMLDAKHKSSYIRGMNKLPLKTRVQILSHALRGLVHAVDLPRCRRVDQHGFEAAGGCR